MRNITNLTSFILIFPVAIFLVMFIIMQFLLRKRKKAFGVAADVTTLLLFFSVANAFNIFFSTNILFILIVVSLVIAIIFTCIEWRKEKEIEVSPLLRKIWRVYFILLNIIYAIMWIIGVIRYVLSYIS